MQQFSSLLSWRLFTAQRVSGVHSSIIRSSMTAVAASGFYFVSWWQSCCVRGRPRTQHGYHHDTKVKPEAATAVIELLMMDEITPETYWAVNKRQDNKLENICFWLVIYLNCTMVHGISNLKKRTNWYNRLSRNVCIYHFTLRNTSTCSWNWMFKMWSTVCVETSVTDYQSRLRNV
jgi:hypothetical protein